MTPSADPAVAGIVASLDHPGGNITGITEMMPELAAQRFALLKELVPGLSRIAILWRPGTLSPATIEKVQRDIETNTNPAVPCRTGMPARPRINRRGSGASC
jgi:ABC-type uncharacterized transport system substrate-binding protein